MYFCDRSERSPVQEQESPFAFPSSSALAFDKEKEEWLYGWHSKEKRRLQQRFPASETCQPHEVPEEVVQGDEGLLLVEGDGSTSSDATHLDGGALQLSSETLRREKEEMQNYVRCWAKLDAFPPDEISHKDVPWLPQVSPPDSFKVIGISEHVSTDCKRAALRHARLRWHPDRFLSKFGTSLAPEDKKRIMQDVASTFQRVDALARLLE